MAVCKYCGLVNSKLPGDWVNWECLQCFIDSSITCDGIGIDKETCAAIIVDMEKKREALNTVLVKKKMEAAYEKQ